MESRFLRFSISAAVTLATLLAAPTFAFGQVYHPYTTRKIEQLTGDFDGTLRRPTISRTNTRAGVRATDLGSTFEHKGRLYFLFGDTLGRTGTEDCLAYTTATSPRDIDLTFPLDTDGKYIKISVPGIVDTGMCVPSGGISRNDIIYIVHTTQWNGATSNMEKSVMASSADDGATWSNLYTLSEVGPGGNMSNTHFINVSLSIANSEDWPGLPYEGDNLIIYGSGAYRKSNVYLAAMPADSIDDPSTIRYLSGVLLGAPQWSASEADAIALFNQPYVGEFSCYWIPQLEKWVMLYNSEPEPLRGINMRTADAPWGPFSAVSLILHPWDDEAYGRYMHVSWEWGRRDAFHDNIQINLQPNHNMWGGEYGPYLIPRWTTGDATRAQIYYTMSTWNPYQVVLIRSEVGAGVPPHPPVSRIVQDVPGSSAWTVRSGNWFGSFTQGSKPWITTFVSSDADQGVMYRWLPRDLGNRSITFEVHGGNAEVMLLEGDAGEIPVNNDVTGIYADIKAGVYGEVVQCTWGHSSNDINIPVTWDLRRFDSANLRLVVIDNRTDAWGFVSVSRMDLARVEPGSVRVNLGPADAVAAGAQWRVVGGEWQDSGATLANVPAGQQTIEFKQIEDWVAPAGRTVNVVSNGTAEIDAEYTLPLGARDWPFYE